MRPEDCPWDGVKSFSQLNDKEILWLGRKYGIAAIIDYLFPELREPVKRPTND